MLRSRDLAETDNGDAQVSYQVSHADQSWRVLGAGRAQSAAASAAGGMAENVPICRKRHKGKWDPPFKQFVMRASLSLNVLFDSQRAPLRRPRHRVGALRPQA
jgi:hypothetical protein